ncbi:hypothetical protein FPV67DRAFT_787459 [Lyophyllum atratum]|nr:hypothetical protein FPV67DRAFT_787459 [Lyophyllum atratum]
MDMKTWILHVYLSCMGRCGAVIAIPIAHGYYHHEHHRHNSYSSCDHVHFRIEFDITRYAYSMKAWILGCCPLRMGRWGAAIAIPVIHHHPPLQLVSTTLAAITTVEIGHLTRNTSHKTQVIPTSPSTIVNSEGAITKHLLSCLGFHLPPLPYSIKATNEH